MTDPTIHWPVTDLTDRDPTPADVCWQGRALFAAWLALCSLTGAGATWAVLRWFHR